MEDSYRDKEGESWISISDLMTGLMVIFLFISVSYMLQIQQKQDETKAVVNSHLNVKDKLKEELKHLIKVEMADWAQYIEFDENNLSVRFVGDDIQFKPNQDRVRTTFVRVLNDFLPKYLSVIGKEKYRKKIAEVRIEGHAHDPHQGSGSIEHYLEGLNWSQRRAKSVLAFVIKSAAFQDMSNEQKNHIEFWLTANGYGYARTVDQNLSYTRLSKEPVCAECSRRVEFRIITSSEDVINDIIKELE